MSEELGQLSYRLVRCKSWRWLPGMLWWTDDDHGRLDDFQPEYMGRPTDALPDLTDPATLGCLLQLVREAWGMPTGITVSYSSDDGLWGVSWSGATHGGWCGRGKTEAEALFVALEAAP